MFTDKKAEHMLKTRATAAHHAEPKTLVITHLFGLQSFKVTDFGTNRKFVVDLL